MSASRPATERTTRVVEEMVVMLGEMEIHEIRIRELARRAGVAIPTVYYAFRSINDIIAEATVLVLQRFLTPLSEPLDEMSAALARGDVTHFRDATSAFMDQCWSRETNDGIHRLAPLIAYFRQIAPDDKRLRAVQSREVMRLIDVLAAARARGWLSADADVSTFVIVHWTCVLGQAVFFHPAFGPLTAIDFTDGTGRLRYQTTLDAAVGHLSVATEDEASGAPREGDAAII